MIRHKQGILPTLLPLIVLLSLVISCLGIFVDSAHAQTKLSGPNRPYCTDVHVIGVRGSTEKKRPDELNMGNPVYATYKRFQSKVRGITVDGQGLNYPANATDTAKSLKIVQYDVIKEDAQITTILIVHHNICPDQQFILMGYSQGTWVIHATIKSLEPSLREKIKAIVLYGDPLFDPSSQFATGSKAGSGLMGREDLAGLLQNGRDYCNAGDFLCNATQQNTSYCELGKNLSCSHYKYNEDNSGNLHEETANYLASLFPSASKPFVFNDYETTYSGTIHSLKGNISANIKVVFHKLHWGEFTVYPPISGSGPFDYNTSGSKIWLEVDPKGQLYFIEFSGTMTKNGNVIEMSGTYYSGENEHGTWYISNGL